MTAMTDSPFQARVIFRKDGWVQERIDEFTEASLEQSLRQWDENGFDVTVETPGRKPVVLRQPEPPIVPYTLLAPPATYSSAELGTLIFAGFVCVAFGVAVGVAVAELLLK